MPSSRVFGGCNNQDFIVHKRQTVKQPVAEFKRFLAFAQEATVSLITLSLVQQYHFGCGQYVTLRLVPLLGCSKEPICRFHDHVTFGIFQNGGCRGATL